MLEEGYYEVFGNTVEVEDEAAFDLDANEEMPLSVVYSVGTFLGKEL